MTYLTFDEYKQKGGELELTAFNRYVLRACKKIDNATFCRIENMTHIPDEVKECCRDIIDMLYNYTDISTTHVTSRSQSALGVSQSESYSIKTEAEVCDSIDDVINDYLGGVTDDKGVYLLYRGVSA